MKIPERQQLEEKLDLLQKEIDSLRATLTITGRRLEETIDEQLSVRQKLSQLELDQELRYRLPRLPPPRPLWRPPTGAE